jgi:hypothetical protein
MPRIDCDTTVRRAEAERATRRRPKNASPTPRPTMTMTRKPTTIVDWHPGRLVARNDIRRVAQVVRLWNYLVP